MGVPPWIDPFWTPFGPLARSSHGIGGAAPPAQGCIPPVGTRGHIGVYGYTCMYMHIHIYTYIYMCTHVLHPFMT